MSWYIQTNHLNSENNETSERTLRSGGLLPDQAFQRIQRGQQQWFIITSTH